MRWRESAMTSNWQRLPVSQLEAAGILLVQDGNHGEYRPRREELVADGTPHVRAADIGDDGTIDFSGAQRINEAALARIKKGVGSRGDVLLTHKGTVGRVARVPADAPHFVCSPQTTFWRSLDGDQLDQAFLFAYMRSSDFAEQLRARMHESDMAPYVSLTAQRSFTLLLPPIAEQRGIASVLGALDGKIDSNRSLATALHDAVLCAQSRSRVDVTRSVSLADAALSVSRGISPKYVEEGGVMVLNQRCVRKDTIQFGRARRHDGAARSVDRHELAIGDLLVNSTGVGTLGRVARIGWLPEYQVVVDSHVTVVRPDPNAADPEFLAAELLARQGEIAQLGEGSTGQTELSRARLSSFEIALPDIEVQRTFGAMARTCWALRAILEQESETLTGVRDTVLARLLSGELRVPATTNSNGSSDGATERLAGARA